MRTLPRKWGQDGGGQDYPATCDYCGCPWPRSKLRRDGAGRLACPQEGPGLSTVELAKAEAEFLAQAGNWRNMSDGNGFQFDEFGVEYSPYRDSMDEEAQTYDPVPEELGADGNFDFSLLTLGAQPTTLTDSISGAQLTQPDSTKRATVVDWPGNGIPGLKGLQFSQSSPMFYEALGAAAGWSTIFPSAGARMVTFYAVVASPSQSTSYLNEWLGISDTTNTRDYRTGFWNAVTSEFVTTQDWFREGTAYAAFENLDEGLFTIGVQGATVASRGVGIVWGDIWATPLAALANAQRYGICDEVVELYDAVKTKPLDPVRICLGSSYPGATSTPQTDVSRAGLILGQLVFVKQLTIGRIDPWYLDDHRSMMAYLSMRWGVGKWL